MQRLTTATVLNFVLPGAGLCYLGRWAWGIANLLVVTAIGGSIALADQQLFNDISHYLVLAFAAGSAGLAHSVASRIEKASQ